MNKDGAWGSILGVLLGVIYVAFGVIMMQNPDLVLKTLSLGIGWSLLIVGTIMMIENVVSNGFKFTDRVFELTIVIILGVIFIFGSKVNNILILSYLLLFWSLADTSLQMPYLIHARKNTWTIIALVLNIAVIVFTLYIIFNPGMAQYVLVYYIGIGFLMNGITKITKEM